MTINASIETAWEVLERVGGGDLRIRYLEDGDGKVAVGLDAIGRRHLLFQVLSDVIVVEDRASDGVQIVRHVLEDDDGRRIFVDVVCTNSVLKDLFENVAIEMIREAQQEQDRPDLACRRVLDRWREFLSRATAGVSGPEKVAGLFGELVHLRELLARNPSALDLWTGPLGARHDFGGIGAYLEVKTSLSRHGRFFEISTYDQLDPMPGFPLYLGCLKLERVPTGGVDLSQMVDELAALGAPKGRLLTLMAQAGMQPADLSPGGFAYRIDEHRVYEVTPAFPAITPKSFVGGVVPSGVLRVRYMIDLTAEPPTPLSDADVQGLYGLVAGHG